MTAFDSLIEQIDSFIRKYYKSEILKGFIIVFAFLLGSWLLISSIEYYGRFSSIIRFLFLLFFVSTNLYLLLRYFIIPFLKLYSFGKRINRFQAASIIGTFFPTISDRLLNTLQLNEFNASDANYELIRASVVQRSNDLLTVKFVDAVKFDESKKYFKFLIPISIFFFSVLAFYPTLILKGSSNVVNFSQAQEAPFSFQLLSSLDDLKEGSSYDVQVQIKGLFIPNDVYIVSNRGTFKLQKIRKNIFSIPFQNLKSSLTFNFKADGFFSKNYVVSVLGASSLGSLQAKLFYPSYIHKPNEVVNNLADLTLPEGTRVEWSVKSKNVSSIFVSSRVFKQNFFDSMVSFASIYKSDDKVSFLLKNSFLPIIDTASVVISIVKDNYPLINVSESFDTLKPSVRSFEGSISDDYGLKSLVFYYEIQRENGSSLKRHFSVLTPKGVSQQFSFAVDFSKDDIQLNDKISYYFTVTDNDQINGSKATRSQQFIYTLPSLSDLNVKRDESNEELKASLNNVLKRADQFKKDVSKFQKDISQKNYPDYKSLEQLQSIQQQQQQLQQDLMSIQEKFDASNQEKSKLTEQDQQLLEQQEMIDNLLKEVMDDELKKLLDELQQLIEKNQTNQLKQESQKLNQSTDQLKSQMNRTLEMLKRMQVDEKIDNLENQLKELSKEQEQLSNDSKSKDSNPKEQLDKQNELNKRFDEIKKDLQELDQLNQQLERPMNMDTNSEMQNSISEDQNAASEQLSKDSKSKASSKQKSAGDKMLQLASQLDQQQQNSKSQQNEEDMESIRVLLENLIQLSLSQEQTMNHFEKNRSFDQRFTKLGKQQRRIVDDFKSVQDSLLSIAKRQPKISSFIDNELSDINSNFSLISEEYRERKLKPMLIHQQYVMTSFNNLALMLNESLQQMQAQGNPKMSGSGSCSNPNGSGKKPSEGEMSGDSMKEMLKSQLEKLKKGSNPGGKSPGNQPGEGNLPIPLLSNMELAKMAAQQFALRQQLEKMKNDLNKDGSGTGNKLNPLINELDKQVNDLINKKFSPDLIRRQQDILTRLLESESVLRMRGFDEKRESTSGKNQNFGNLIRFDEYKGLDKKQIELVRGVEPILNLYYKSMASKYFNLH